jgi:protein-disulfide isomerase
MRTLLGLASALALSACSDSEEPLPWKTVEISPFLGDPVMGDPNAPVEIVEYASTTCGHCATFHEQMLPQLKEGYIDTGKAKLRWIVMPTPPAELSVAGAALARCAGEDKFFDVIADLFETQDALIKAAAHPRRLQDTLVALGARHGLNADEVGTCIGDAKVHEVTIAGAQAAPATVTGTPSFFVNGQQVDENSADAIAAVIDAKLGEQSAN